ncbi:hypothetical protein CROQUDRAFT_688468 [Cronartium quercuum f. sp. fusiforme G11]|uniref:Uncharacterized protein n=1 Tax=Cronartium quercuum f. sp. fusiforme G11 TaxID=708437 RepID=A0A9P6NTR9_9BASI|nr:hypothetical protein CROQUDRAFT_688468 [Cronartium quercuum f. sp. fusiforme G11]
MSFCPLDITLPPSPTLTEVSEPNNLIPIPAPESSFWMLHSSLDPNASTFTNLPALVSSIQNTMTTIIETSETTSSGILLLEQDNFHQWKGAMFSYFLEHNLDGIVDGIEPKPDSTHPVELANWLLREKKAAGFIARKLDTRNRDLLVNEENQ